MFYDNMKENNNYFLFAFNKYISIIKQNIV